MTRFETNMKTGLRGTAVKWAIACAVVVGFVPAIASAQVHDFRRHDRGGRYDRRDHDRRNRDRSDVRIGIDFGTPSYERRVERVWVEPVYRTEWERIWIEPVYRMECERVWIEPVYEIRERVVYEYGRRVVYRDRVLVSRGRWEERPRQVLITPGRWETVERRVLVSAGHWEERIISYPTPGPVFSFGFGYRR